MSKMKLPKKKSYWSATLVKMLRGSRTHSEFARLIHVRPSTVEQWEKLRAAPNDEQRRRLDRLAKRERFLADWKLAGSMTLLGDLEEGSREIAKEFKRAEERSVREFFAE